MQFDQAYFDRGISRRGTRCEKWDDPGMLPEDGIPLWVADMDFPCAPAIEEAVKKRAEHPCFGYNNEAAEEACARALCAFWRRRTPPSSACTTRGSTACSAIRCPHIRGWIFPAPAS